MRLAAVKEAVSGYKLFNCYTLSYSMSCYHPLKGWLSSSRNENGKREVVFTKQGAYVDMPVQVPCGKCVGCLMDRSRSWAIRCHHEAKSHDENCFITLTYSDENLPQNGSLVKSDFQKFMKRLRKSTSRRVRYFMCGEYGDQTKRPHYHALLFGYDFADKVLFRRTAQGDKVYTSDALARLWPYGLHEIGTVSFRSAAYVARYVTKKLHEDNDTRYMRVDPATGELFHVEHEYVAMSSRPGIGSSHYDKYHNDIYPDDFVVVNGQKYRTPRYYDKKLEKDSDPLLRKIKSMRKKRMLAMAHENTSDRLAVKETIKKAQLEQLKRNL